MPRMEGSVMDERRVRFVLGCRTGKHGQCVPTFWDSAQDRVQDPGALSELGLGRTHGSCTATPHCLRISYSVSPLRLQSLSRTWATIVQIRQRSQHSPVTRSFVAANHAL